MKKIIGICVLLFSFLLGCKETNKTTMSVLNKSDYDLYLVATFSNIQKIKKEQEFWEKRLTPDSSGIGDLGPLAASYSALFHETGAIENLYKAEKLYKKAITVSANNKDVYTRSLARNYISQHRFKEAKNILEQSYSEISNKKATEYQLFDIYMETGDYEKAYENLEKVKNLGSYDYLIRLAKWSDYRGELDAAIHYLEKAKDIAKASGNKNLEIWTYSNLGDFYGHAGRITDAYNMYLATLKIAPSNAYAKKGLSWIAFANDKNTLEANRILDSIMVSHKAPDYYLLKSEIAYFDGNEKEAKKQEQLFLEALASSNYGNMYNAYLIPLLVDIDPVKSLKLANQEIHNRATPETYHLLALAQLKNNMVKEALKTIKTQVEGKTEEPMALIHAAYVYKANGMDKKVNTIKKELEEVSFEIGPVLSNKISEL